MPIKINPEFTIKIIENDNGTYSWLINEANKPVHINTVEYEKYGKAYYKASHYLRIEIFEGRM